MFDSIVMRRLRSKNNALDAGLLAEALLFYQNVHLLLEHGSLASLLRSIGPNNLNYLIENKLAKVTFFKNSLGVYTNTLNGLPTHDFTTFQFKGTQEKGLYKRKKDLLIHIFERALGETRDSRRAAKKFLSRVPVKDMNQGFNHPQGIGGLARDDLNDPDYVQAAIEAVLTELVPNIVLPKKWNFGVIKTSSGFVTDSNLNFEDINKEYHKTVPPEHSTITPGFLLSEFLHARADICFSSRYLSEFITTPAASKIMRIKFANLLEKRFENARQIELFQEMHLGEARQIRNAINSGERSFDEFLEVLDKAQKFKKWLGDTNPDIGILTEYYKSTVSDTWVEKLPTKGARFVFFTGAGLLVDAVVPTGFGTASGVALGAADAFVIDKFLKGWRPNQFIEGPLGDFTDNP